MTNEKPLRVLYVGSPELFSKGASAIHIMKMCQAMGRLGVSTELAIASNKKHGEILEYYGVESNFRITSFPYFRNSSARNIVHGLLGSLYAGFKRGGFDIAVTRNIVFTYFATSLFGIPTVYDAHHPLVKGARFLFNSFKDSKSLIRFTANSRGLGEIYLEEGLPPEKLVIAHNGVDPAPFNRLPSKEEARAELGLPSDKNIVCYAGNIYEGRGIEYLIDVSLTMKDVLFLIVGGRERDVARYGEIARRKQAGNFILKGFVHHRIVPLYLSASDLLVMPYTSGMTIRGGTVARDFTSPIKLFEYMASRRPIVATAIPSVCEILEDGVNAVLVRPDSSDKLHGGIKKILENPALADRLAVRALEDVRGYTWEERAKKLLNLP
ncbi:MAG: glycosyltransferase [Deltaproteobacteria bacterium]